MDLLSGSFKPKALLIGYITAILVAIILWYRNNRQDRILSAYILIFGLILLIMYSVQSGIDPVSAGNIISVIIWVGILILLGISYTQLVNYVNWTIFMIILLIVVITLLIMICCNGFDLIVDLNQSISQPPVWYNFSIVYIVLLLIPLVLISLFVSTWDVIILSLVLIISALCLYFLYPQIIVPSLWFYVAVSSIIIIWAIGFLL